MMKFEEIRVILVQYKPTSL